MYKEDRFDVIIGGLHRKIAALPTLGNWLKGSDWVEALAQAEITTAGTTDSFLRAATVAYSRPSILHPKVSGLK